MKTKLFFLFILVLFTVFAYAQLDNQWLIINNIGKDGTNLDHTNRFRNALPSNFILRNVANPVVSPTRPARNDLFVIYMDGTHFNTRYELGSGTFFPGPGYETSINHSFITPGNPVRYMYLTNRYEGDDLPTNVILQPSSNTLPPPVYTLGRTNSYPGRLMEANHDVVQNKDITLIIDQDSLHVVPQDSQAKFFVVFNNLIPLSSLSPPAGIGPFFTLDPIFVNGSNPLEAVFPENTFDASNQQRIRLIYNASKPFTYINLIPTEKITLYGPDRQGDPRYAAEFKIVDARDNIIEIHKEPIVASHDPNFLRVAKICKSHDGTQIVSYYLQFRNTSRDQAASMLKVQITFPHDAIQDCIHLVEWSPAGDPAARDVNHPANIWTITYDPAMTLSVCSDIDGSPDCTGYLKFNVGFPSSVDVQDINYSLRLPTIVTFDQYSYPVLDFEDLIDTKGDTLFRPAKIANCSCGNGPCGLPCILGGIAAAIIAAFLFMWRRRRRRL